MTTDRSHAADPTYVPGASHPAPSAAMANGKMEASLNELLKQFGVTSSSDNDKVRAVVEEELLARGLEAEVVDLRYGKLTLRARAVHARLLGFDKDQVLAALENQVPGAVRTITVHTQR